MAGSVDLRAAIPGADAFKTIILPNAATAPKPVDAAKPIAERTHLKSPVAEEADAQMAKSGGKAEQAWGQHKKRNTDICGEANDHLKAARDELEIGLNAKLAERNRLRAESSQHEGDDKFAKQLAEAELAYADGVKTYDSYSRAMTDDPKGVTREGAQDKLHCLSLVQVEIAQQLVNADDQPTIDSLSRRHGAVLLNMRELNNAVQNVDPGIRLRMWNGVKDAVAGSIVYQSKERRSQLGPYVADVLNRSGVMAELDARFLKGINARQGIASPSTDATIEMSMRVAAGNEDIGTLRDRVHSAMMKKVDAVYTAQAETDAKAAQDKLDAEATKKAQAVKSVEASRPVVVAVEATKPAGATAEAGQANLDIAGALVDIRNRFPGVSGEQLVDAAQALKAANNDKSKWNQALIGIGLGLAGTLQAGATPHETVAASSSEVTN